jgi:hypothetical protein
MNKFLFFLLKAFEFAESLLKLASSDPLLILDNRFLGVALGAFENRPVTILLILKIVCKFNRFWN